MLMSLIDGARRIRLLSGRPLGKHGRRCRQVIIAANTRLHGAIDVLGMETGGSLSATLCPRRVLLRTRVLAIVIAILTMCHASRFHPFSRPLSASLWHRHPGSPSNITRFRIPPSRRWGNRSKDKNDG